MAKRPLIALLLIAVTFGAMVAQASISEKINDAPTGLRPSECYACHKDGGGSLGLPLQEMYYIHAPAEVKIPLGEKVAYPVEVSKAWDSEVELVSIVGAIDVSNATVIGFASDKEPRLDTYPGTVASDPADTNPARQQVQFDVEGGSSDLVVRVVPTQTLPGLSPDLTLRLWPPSRDLGKTPLFTINDAGSGEAETFQVVGASQIVDLGVGTWTAEIVVPDTFSAGGDPSTAIDQPFDLHVDQYFNSTGELVSFQGSDDVIGAEDHGSARALVEWLLIDDEVPATPQTMLIRIDLTAVYDHDPSVSQWDQWRYTKTIEVTVVAVPGEDAVLVQASTVVPVPPKAFIAWDRIGEVIGYASGFLIAASIYTGGMFGKASRRQLNSVFGTAKRRVAFHNFLSYGILLAAIVHTVMFIFVEQAFGWTRGILWGGVAILAMIGLGVTGALQVPMIRRWNYAVWRWSHFYLAIGTMVFTVVHILLDGQNFADVQSAIGWTDPFA